MASLTDKLNAFFGMFPDVKAKADSAEETLLQIGVTSKEETTMDKSKDEEAKVDKETTDEEKKDTLPEKKEFDLTTFAAQLTTNLEASAKETASLKEMLVASAKEVSDLKATVEQGFGAVVKGFEQRDSTIKLVDAKVKELAGEIPNAARPYVPTESTQNMFARIANGQVQVETKELATNPTVPQPNQQTTNPLLDFISAANQGIGLSKQPITNPPQ